jgi:hypothetical protein
MERTKFSDKVFVRAKELIGVAVAPKRTGIAGVRRRFSSIAPVPTSPFYCLFEQLRPGKKAETTFRAFNGR